MESSCASSSVTVTIKPDVVTQRLEIVLDARCERGILVVPVMVSTVEAPLSICRLQWLDMRQCFPVEQHEERYGKQFEDLVTALTEKQVPFEGVQQRLLN